jgi:hypothetical protein
MYRFPRDAFASSPYSADARSPKTSPDPPSSTGRDPPVNIRGDDRQQLLATLLADRQWKCDPATRSRLQALHRCLQPANEATGGPASAPAEAEWALLADEIEHYLDFRRLRHLEAQLHGSTETDFRFDRLDCEVAHAAEAALASHLRRVHEESYLSEQPDLYLHVH